MSLFQKSVLKKYTNDLNKENLEKKWEQFKTHFHNPEVQENIRNAKEEEYQAGFVDDLFVKILGYTVYPNPNFNFRLEKKTDADTTKSDGAILVNGKVAGVLELKDTNTTDLGKVEKQAFGYKHKHPECIYVITSNFQKLRFYINDSIEFIEFDLFKITKEEFVTLVICLEQQHIFKNIPYLIKRNSLDEEKGITNKLYADYSQFKRVLFNNIVALNPQYNKLEIFKKTQKLLDRFLFVLFAEDRLLVPPNSVRVILTDWEKLKELDNYVPLFDRFKKYFGYLNTGHDGKHHEIFAYNGGLFAADEILDNIKIDDDILYNGTTTLSNYDFESEVDVNILGHIFEHSLTEIEEVQAELEGAVIEKTKTKRKKDGVFYTPRYITKYIVENTVGELCRQKKEELKITDEEFAYRKRKDARGTLLKRLDDYRNWLFQITICDPACGSGAFLNQALEFLIAEHHYVDELKATLFGDAMVLTEVETTILENNLFGVDINEEAIEIAKLSLWLRTAKKGRKLNDLSSNIKCGNSLIDDTKIAGNKAFSWQNEFKAVFKNGGFDVVVGNPPYVDVKNLKKEIGEYIYSTYNTSENRINLYSSFVEKGFAIVKSKGMLSYIIPNSILLNSSYKKLRHLILDSILEIVKLPDTVFEDAKVETIIIRIQKDSNSTEVSVIKYPNDVRINFIDLNIKTVANKNDWRNSSDLNFNLYSSFDIYSLLGKVENNSVELLTCAEFSLGITPYDKYKGHSEEDINNRVFHSDTKLNDEYKPLISGENITRYYTSSQIKEFLKYGAWLGRPREERFFLNERIIVRQIISGNPPRIYASYANQPFYYTHHGFGIIPKNTLSVKYILTLLNSSLINFYHSFKFLDLEKKLFQKILIENCKKIPIKIIDNNQQLPFIEKADIMLDKGMNLVRICEQTQKFLTGKYDNLKLTKKLEDWPSLLFKDFLKELSKQKIKLSLHEEAEWMKYFEEQKAIANGIQKEINETDNEIDKMVYELYELTEKEIRIVEGAAN